MNDKDEVVIKIKEAYLKLDEIKDKFNKDSEEALNRLKQIFNSYFEANKNQFVRRRQAVENNIEDLYVHYRETVRVQEMQIEELQNKFRKLNAEE